MEHLYDSVADRTYCGLPTDFDDQSEVAFVGLDEALSGSDKLCPVCVGIAARKLLSRHTAEQPEDVPLKIESYSPDDGGVTIFLTEALALAADAYEQNLLDLFHPQWMIDRSAPHVVTAELFINGMPVPVAATIRTFIEAQVGRVDEAITNRAKELVNAAGLEGIESLLDKLRQTLESAEWQISDTIEKARKAL